MTYSYMLISDKNGIVLLIIIAVKAIEFVYSIVGTAFNTASPAA